MAMISRDPFAREEIHRKRVYTEKTCDWCGCRRMTTKQKPFVFTYRVETDGGRIFPMKGLFCCDSCRKDYQGV